MEAQDISDINATAFMATRAVRSHAAKRPSDAALRWRAQSFLANRDAIIVTDMDGRILDWNPAAERTFGYTREEILGQPVSRLHLPEKKDTLSQAILDSMVRDGSWSGEIPFVRKDGTRGICETSINPLVDEGDQITGAFGVNRDITERKRADEASARLAAIVTSAEDAIASKTLNGIITSWNASAERMFGYTAEEMIGQSVLRLIPPDRQDEEDMILASIRAGKRIEHFETVRVTKDGRLFDVSLTISPVRDSSGTIIGASKIVRDITERKFTERLLAEQNHLLELIATGHSLEESLTELTQAMGRLRPGTRAAILLANESRTKLTTVYAADIPPTFAAGLQDAPINEEAIGTCGTAVLSGQPVACADIANDEQWPRAWRDLCVAHGILACHSEPVIGSDGKAVASLILCFETPRAPTDLELRIAHFGTYIANIAIARKRSEDAVRREEEKFRVLAENIPTLAWTARPDGYITWYNRRWYEYTGTTPETQEGWGWQSVHDPDVLPEVMERWLHTIATVTPFEMVFPLRGADGLFRPFLTRIVPLKDERGQVAGWVGTNTDISEQRAAEDALRAANDVLETASSAKDEFLGIASHELRTPLTSIIANVQLANKQMQALLRDMEPAEDGSPANSKIKRAALLLERTERQVSRMDRLVGDLLDVSRIQAGKLDLRPEPGDLLALVRDAVDAQRAAWPNRPIALDLPQRGSLPFVGDGDRVGQVVTNLLTNALKYSAADQPVEVSVRVREGSVRIAVRDRGPGLTSEQQAHLFERFFRVPGIEQQSGSGIGLGLGLYICKTIVERHGGTIGVESAPGAGSTFWFVLPLDS